MSSEPASLAEIVSHWREESMTFPQSVIRTERVFLPQDTSMTLPLVLPSITKRFIGADSGLTTATILSAQTVFPNPILTNLIDVFPC